jgi:protein SCO1/2
MDALKKHGFKIVVVLFVVAVAVYAYMELFGGKRFPVLKEAAEFSLRHVDGSEVSLANTDGKVRLIYFFFSHCPDVCPPTTQILGKVQEELIAKKALGTKAYLMSVTIDPLRDTPERLREYSAYFDARLDGGWYFLRSETEQEVWDLAQQYSVGVRKLDNGDFIHSNIYVLVDKEGRIRHYYLIGEDVLMGDTNKLAKEIAGDMISLARK